MEVRRGVIVQITQCVDTLEGFLALPCGAWQREDANGDVGYGMVDYVNAYLSLFTYTEGTEDDAFVWGELMRDEDRIGDHVDRLGILEEYRHELERILYI